MDGNSNIARAWLEYGRSYAKHRSLWDGSLAFASGPLFPEGETLRDRSFHTAGAAWSVGAGDQPKYVQGSVRGQTFWAGQYDGTDDVAEFDNILVQVPQFTISTWLYKLTSSNTIAVFPGRYHSLLGVGGGLVPSGQLGFAVFSGAWYHADGPSVPVGTWFHATAVFTKGVSLEYIHNGTDIYSSVMPDTYLNAYPTVNFRNFFGAYGNYGSLSSLWNGSIASPFIWTRRPTSNEISILARHPLESYRVNVPRYWMFGTTTTAKRWPWQIRRQRRMAGAR